jgi:FAD/FMN-containing dehydrogenase
VQRRNWSGSVRLRPAEQLRPTRVDTIARAVSRARRHGRCVRAIGSAHSSNEQLCSDDVIVRMSEYAGVIEVDRPNCLATVRAGTSLAELGAALHEHDLALPNYGDIALQTLGGAIGTGTHGTGSRLQNLSQMLEAVDLVDGRGEMRSVRAESDDPHAPGRNLCAARVALGCLGVMTNLTIRCVPAFDVERREYALATDALLDGFEQFADCNRSVDFYWYPRRDDVKLRVINAVGGGGAAPPDARLLELASGPSHQLIPAHSGLTHRFEECEFSLPVEHGLDCFRAVRLRMIERWRATVGWRVLYRLVAADSAWLSPAQGRESRSSPSTAAARIGRRSTITARRRCGRCIRTGTTSCVCVRTSIPTACFSRPIFATCSV